MASVLALLGTTAFRKYAKRVEPGTVLPIKCFQTSNRTFATELSRGGALYLVVAGEKTELWLVAVLEMPESSGIKIGDKRKPGWYAPPNTTPVTNITKLRRTLKMGRDTAAAFAHPRILEPEMDRALRELLDEVDAPVISHVEAAASVPALDAKLPPLERATRYLGGGHIAPAIQALAESWRDSPVPAIADLIDRATRLQPESHRPLFDKQMGWNDQATAQKIWTAAFKADPVAAMPQLLLNLAIGRGEEAVKQRAKQLARLPLDPRFGARIVELLSVRTYGAATWWAPIVDLWLSSKDARMFESILELESREMHLGPKTKKVYAMARTAPPRLADADRPAVEKLEAELHRLEEPVRVECALVDQIAANPDDDGAYLVYADWLMERGRPLGEYITLTCQQRTTALSPAQARRLGILLDVPYLCGAFDDMPAQRRRKRERGIDRELTVYWSTQPRSWRLFAASPLVRALTRIDLVGAPLPGRAEAIAELVRAAPALDRIGNLDQATAKALATLLGDTFVVKRGVEIDTDENHRPIYSADLVRATRAGRSR